MFFFRPVLAVSNSAAGYIHIFELRVIIQTYIFVHLDTLVLFKIVSPIFVFIPCTKPLTFLQDFLRRQLYNRVQLPSFLFVN